MRRGFVWLATVLSCAAATETATAQTGGRLYEPFSEPVSNALVRDYIERLPAGGARIAAELTDEQIERGVLLGARSAPTGPSGASGRARARDPLAPSMGWPLGLLLASLPLAALVALATRRRLA